ncbi:MAG TPA: efflux RND transporter periplasmic adaptor subunit [Bacteroidota bacterium]|nr:efflux RND transporter periplasmic adaptor subunit [Bacteroidota bacterium]
MKISLRVMIPLVIGVLFVGGFVYRLTSNDAAREGRRANLPLVKVELPLREKVLATLKFSGDVVAGQQALIYSKVTGNLERELVNIGMYVQKNQLLASIDTTELYQTMQQNLASYENARVTYLRGKDLFDRSLLAKQDLDNLEAAMKVAKANYEVAQTHLSYARITAPFAGVITKRYLDQGAVVTVNNTSLFMLMDIDLVKISINVQEKDVNAVHIGTPAILTVDAFPGKEFHGAVSRYGDALDLSTRTMPVELDIPNRDHLLKPGMFATVVLVVDTHPNSLTVATQAVMQDDTGSFVYCVHNKLARRQRVTLGVPGPLRTEILSGANDGDSVITIGQQLLKPGGGITVQP